MKLRTLSAIALLALGAPALGAGDAKKPKNIDFSFEGTMGGWDYASVQRGLQVYRQVCSGCHEMQYVAFRMLEDIGLSEEEVKALAAEYQIATVDDYGDPATRPGIPSDSFPAPFANDVAAAAANNGKKPPNLSLMVEAREGGADYVYSLLTGYQDTPPEEYLEEHPEGLPIGAYYNDYYPGHAIAMAQPLYDDFVVYDDGTEASLEQMAKDVTTFLAWAAEPNMVERKRLGLTTILFLIALTGLFYASYRRIWAPVKKGATPWKDKIEAKQ